MKRFSSFLTITFLLLLGQSGPPSSGGGGGGPTTQGIGGGSTNTPGADSVVNVKNYGAKGDGKMAFDASMPVGVPSAGSNANGNLSAPAYTTTLPNALVFSAFSRTGGTLSAGPSGTNVANIAVSAGQNMGLWLGYQLQATAGTVAANTATQSSNGWAALTFAIANGGGTVTVGNATTCTAAGTSTATCTKPTGTGAGDLLIAIAARYPNASADTMATPAGWSPCGNLDTGNASTNAAITCFVAIAGRITGSTAFVTSSASDTPAGTIVDLQGAHLVFDNKITSASAAFVAADQGKLFYLAASSLNGITIPSTLSGTTVQGDGYLNYVLDGTDVYATVPNSTTASISSKTYLYLTDDCAGSNAIQTAINAFTNISGTVWFPQGFYGCSQNLTFPTGTTVILQGAGYFGPEWLKLNVDTQLSAKGSTGIFWPNTIASGAAIQFTSPANTTIQGAQDQIRNMLLEGGVGVGQDGGNGDGIDIVNWSHVGLYNTGVFNFSGHGIYIDAASGGGSAANNYTVDDKIEDDWIHGNGKNGIQIGGNSVVTFLESIFLINNEIESNAGTGIEMDSGTNETIDSLQILGGLVQWDNTPAANPGYEIKQAGSVYGCTIQGVHVEINYNNTIGLFEGNTGVSNLQGCNADHNFFNLAAGTGTTAIKLGGDATHAAAWMSVIGNAVSSGYANNITLTDVNNALVVNNDCATTTCTATAAPALSLTNGSIVSSTGGAIPTATCSGGSTGVSIAAGSTNNRGQIVTSSSASTNCTVTWSAAAAWPQAPFCIVDDAAASITPTGVSVGATSTSSMVIDFASAASKTFNWVCM